MNWAPAPAEDIEKHGLGIFAPNNQVILKLDRPGCQIEQGWHGNIRHFTFRLPSIAN